MLHLHLLGPFTLRRDGAELRDLASHRQKVALLAFLAVEGAVPRSRLIEVFWAEREDDRARHALAQALYALRRELGEDTIEVAGDRVSLGRGQVECDVHRVQAAAQADDWVGVAGLYGGHFLDHFFLADCHAFDEWQTRTRAWLASLARKAFTLAVAERYAAGDLPAALTHARRWAELEPLDDEAQHAHIALLAIAGSRAVALEEYEAYRQRLRRELEVEPLDETAALVQEVRAGRGPAAALLREVELPPGMPRPADPSLRAAAVPHPPQPPSTSPPQSPPVPQHAPAPPMHGHSEEALAHVLRPRLELLRKLRETASAAVYLAREPALNHTVELRVLHPALLADARARMRFEREVLAIASLAHPNIVALHWAGALPEGAPFFVTQHVEGVTLEDKLRLEGRLPVADARRILAGLASALDAAHRRGIVHRDVRPGTVVYEATSQRAVLADFGVVALTQAADPASRLTMTGELIGDPRWLSPEQLEGRGLGPRSDVYALGLLGYQLLAEEDPHGATSRQDVYAARLEADARPLGTLRPDADAGLAEMLARCLAREPNRRPSAMQVAEALSGAPREAATPPRRNALGRMVDRLRGVATGSR